MLCVDIFMHISITSLLAVFFPHTVAVGLRVQFLGSTFSVQNTDPNPAAEAREEYSQHNEHEYKECIFLRCLAGQNEQGCKSRKKDSCDDEHECHGCV